MFSVRKNKVHSTFDPQSKTIQQTDHQELSKALQQVTGQLNLMLELQQQQYQQQQPKQQQETKNSHKLANFGNTTTLDEHLQYDCPHHCQQRESCNGNTYQPNPCCSNTRINQQNSHQQWPVSPSLSSFFSSTHLPQHQCMSIYPPEVWQQNLNPSYNHQPSYGYTSCQQPQCSNSKVYHCRQPCHRYPQPHYYHHCTNISNNLGPCSGTHLDLPATITTPKSTTIPKSVKSQNVSDHTATHRTPSFGQSDYIENNIPYTARPPSDRTTTTSHTLKPKFNKPHPDPPLPSFPGFGPYDTNDDASTANDFYENDHHDTQQQSTSPSFPTLANPSRKRKTENLSHRRHHHPLSWTDIYRQDLLSQQDALISPTVSSCNNNLNTIHANEVKKTKQGHSYLRSWWIHGKYRWNQLRKKKFTKCFISP